MGLICLLFRFMVMPWYFRMKLSVGAPSSTGCWGSARPAKSDHARGLSGAPQSYHLVGFLAPLGSVSDERGPSFKGCLAFLHEFGSLVHGFR